MPGSRQWVIGTDAPSGISFALPGKAKTQTRPGNDGTPGGKRAYVYAVNADFNLSVTIMDGTVTAEDLDVMPDQLAEQMQAAGATDASVSERERTTVGGSPGRSPRTVMSCCCRASGSHSSWMRSSRTWCGTITGSCSPT